MLETSQLQRDCNSTSFAPSSLALSPPEWIPPDATPRTFPLLIFGLPLHSSSKPVVRKTSMYRQFLTAFRTQR